ncbi:MAG: LysR family transcriptional regulator [Bacteroidota bacterium]
MELKYYRLIKTIAEEGNIANSAGRLFLTQSALSHQLKEIEERLGFKIFHRKRNKWILTPEGAELYSLANQLFSAIEKGFDTIQNIKEGTKGAIRLSVECQSFFHDIPEFIQKMAILYPEIDIELNLGTRHEILSQLKSDKVDIALVSEEPAGNKFHVIEFYQDEIFAIVHKEHFFNKNDYVDPNLFESAHLIINSFPLEGVAVYEHCLRANNITPKRITAIPFTEIALSMVASNLGVMCAPKWQLKPFKLHDDLEIKRIGVNGIKRRHYLITPSALLKKNFISNFIATFEESFVD